MDKKWIKGSPRRRKRSIERSLLKPVPENPLFRKNPHFLNSQETSPTTHPQLPPTSMTSESMAEPLWADSRLWRLARNSDTRSSSLSIAMASSREQPDI